MISWRQLCLWLFALVVATLALGISGCGDGADRAGGPSWTVMVYLDGDNDLEEAALTDFNEMEAALGQANTKVVVLFDRSDGHTTAHGNWTGTRLYEVTHDANLFAMASNRLEDPDGLGITLAGDEELNMGRGQTLARFVDFCEAAYPADRTALILWNHGSGWAPSIADTTPLVTKGIGYDDTSGEDALSMKEVAGALSGHSVDLLGFDACLMAEIEVAWEIRSNASLMVASQGLEPASGWDYTAFLNRFNALDGVDRTAMGMARAISESYAQSKGTGMALTLSVIDLTALAPLKEALSQLGDAIKDISADAVTIAREKASDFNDKTAVDIRHFSESLPISETLGKALNASIDEAVAINVSANPDEACGLSLYFPIFGSSDTHASHYTPTTLSFVADASWAKGLAAYETRATYYTMETLPGAKGLDTQLTVYTDAHDFMAENDDRSSVPGYSRLRIPVAAGKTYYMRVSSLGSSLYAPGTWGYWVYAGAHGNSASWSGAEPALDIFEHDNHADMANTLLPGKPQAHTLTRYDEDWMTFTVPSR